MRLPTVQIKAAEGDSFIVINESDFIEGEHELFDEVKTPKEGTVAWYKMQLDLKNVEFESSATKAELKAIYDGLES